jgi:lipoate-protein ligase A
MALDRALAESVAPGVGTLRLYRWDPPTVSLGRNQPASGRYDLEEARRLGVGFVRRPTGGRAVLHDAEMTYSMVFPDRQLGGARQAYEAINRGLARALRSLGAEVEVAGGDLAQVLAPDAGPCFRTPAPGELVAGDRKVVGSAQARLGGVILQHGSILLTGSQDTLVLLGEEPDPLHVPPVTLEELLGTVPRWRNLAGAVVEGLMEELGGEWVESGYTEAELDRARVHEERFRSEEWTWRV